MPALIYICLTNQTKRYSATVTAEADSAEPFPSYIDRTALSNFMYKISVHIFCQN
jgi:hypothetical protein